MKVTGFSFIKNAVTFQYPVVEALQSILPLCDNVIVAVGDSQDGTRDVVAGINPQKIKILDTVWDESLREGGRVLAVETDKAFQAIGSDADWCVYIQGDEVLHENGYTEIQEAMQRWKHDARVDGLLFKYLHFYGSYQYVGMASSWYRREIRIIKNNKRIHSYRDAQGFRKEPNEKLRVKPLDACIYHYGWVREPAAMEAKYNDFERHWSGAAWEAPKVYTGSFDYSKIDALEKFSGAHPAVMQPRIERMNWQFEHDLSHNKIKVKDRFKNLIEKWTGKRPFDHNNFIIV
jgi:hypothetical protein